MLNHLRPHIIESEYSLISSLDIVDNRKHATIASNQCMVSFGFVSLFTSIPLEPTSATIVHLLDYFHLDLRLIATTELLDHGLSNIFQFNNNAFAKELTAHPWVPQYLALSPKLSYKG